MSKKKRRQFTAKAKADLLRRHLVDKVAVSTICEEEGIQPSLFYGWQRDAMARLEGAMVAQPSRGGRERELEQQNAALRAKLAKKDAVIAEISENL